MKLFKSNFSTLLIITAIITFSSCEKEPINNEAELSVESNLETKKGSGLVQEYFCSEYLGGYTSDLYVGHPVYLNSSYVPSPSPNPSPNSVKYATWMTNLQSWLHHDFHNANPIGSNTESFYMEFHLYGVSGSGLLSAEDGNRVYNEFVCLLMDELSVSLPDDLDDYDIYFEDLTLDFISNSARILSANGTAYY